jgi:hypothetical protein
MASLAHRISVALDKLPSLEVLRVDRSEEVKDGVGSSMDPQPPGSTMDVDLASRHPTLKMLPEPQTIELFCGMDDVSWMYLDAYNPVTFESFPVDYCN